MFFLQGLPVLRPPEIALVFWRQTGSRKPAVTSIPFATSPTRTLWKKCNNFVTVEGIRVGRIMEKVRIQNYGDIFEVSKGQIDEGQIRTTEVEAVVDTGATYLCLPPSVIRELGLLYGSSGKWGGGTWFGAFRIPNLVPRSLVNIVGCSSRGRGNCGKLRAISNWASKPVIRSFPSAVRTVEKQLRALASSPPELLVFPRFA